MDIIPALKSQYHASLRVLRLAMTQCPDGVWIGRSDDPAAFWRVSYHTLFFTHMYLSKDEKSLVPWERHRKEAVDLDSGEGSDFAVVPPYTREELLGYWSFCDGLVDTALMNLDLSAASCGFSWYTMPKLEHQLVNIRHIQHHAASLSMRLRLGNGVEVKWVGKGG